MDPVVSLFNYCFQGQEWTLLLASQYKSPKSSFLLHISWLISQSLGPFLVLDTLAMMCFELWRNVSVYTSCKTAVADSDRLRHLQELVVSLIRLEQGENLEENQRNLLQITERFFQAIIGSSSEFPPQLRSVCHCLYQVDTPTPPPSLHSTMAPSCSPCPSALTCLCALSHTHFKLLAPHSEVSWCCSTHCSLHHTHQCTAVHISQLYRFCCSLRSFPCPRVSTHSVFTPQDFIL